MKISKRALCILSPLFAILLSTMMLLLYSCSTEDNRQVSTYPPQTQEDVTGPLSMDIQILCTVRLKGRQAYARIVKLPISDIVYIMEYGLTPLLNSDGEPMTIQEFEKIMNYKFNWE